MSREEMSKERGGGRTCSDADSSGDDWGHEAGAHCGGFGCKDGFIEDVEGRGKVYYVERLE